MKHSTSAAANSDRDELRPVLETFVIVYAYLKGFVPLCATYLLICL